MDGVVVVLVDLGPPHPTAKTSTAAPPNSAIAVLASGFIRPLHSPYVWSALSLRSHAEPLPGRGLGPCMGDQQVQLEPIFAITQQLDESRPGSDIECGLWIVGCAAAQDLHPACRDPLIHRCTNALAGNTAGVEPVAGIAVGPVLPTDKFVANQRWAARKTLMANGFCSQHTARLGHHGSVRGLADHEPCSSSRVRIRSLRLC